MIVAGLGLRAAAQLATLRAMLGDLPYRPDAMALPEDKAGLALPGAIAGALGLPVHPVALAQLRAGAGRTLSPRQPARYGRWSVAETAALAAAGDGARLIMARITAPDGTMTLALAASADHSDADLSAQGACE